MRFNWSRAVLSAQLRRGRSAAPSPPGPCASSPSMEIKRVRCLGAKKISLRSLSFPALPGRPASALHDLADLGGPLQQELHLPVSRSGNLAPRQPLQRRPSPRTHSGRSGMPLFTHSRHLRDRSLWPGVELLTINWSRGPRIMLAPPARGGVPLRAAPPSTCNSGASMALAVTNGVRKSRTPSPGTSFRAIHRIGRWETTQKPRWPSH